MQIITVISAISSVIGAGIAVFSAFKARSYRNEVLRDRLKSVLGEAKVFARQARSECRKIMTPVGEPVRGIDQQQVIDSIRDCLEKVKDNNHKFKVVNLRQSIERTENKINEYVNQTVECGKQAIGDNIYSNLGNIISYLTQEIDNQV